MNFPFFGTRNPGPAAASPAPEMTSLGFDYHSHLLPAVDDGMPDLAQAQAAILDLKALGFTGAVLTPHIYQGVFSNTNQSLNQSFEEFRQQLHNLHLGFSLYLSPEYFANEHFLRLIESDDLIYLQVKSERWVLVEFPTMQEPNFAGVCLSALAARGYRPVIAHVERYHFVAQARDLWLKRFSGYGAVLQGDIGSLAGQHGEEVRKFAMWLEREGRITLWGTDLHKRSQIETYVAPGLRRLKRPATLNPSLDGIPRLAVP